MPYTVVMRNNRTGEVRDILMEGDWDEAADFLWRDGSFADDGNRAIYFHRPFGEPFEDDPPVGSYSILHFILPNGALADGDQDEYV